MIVGDLQAVILTWSTLRELSPNILTVCILFDRHGGPGGSPSTCETRQEDKEFKVILSYIASLASLDYMEPCLHTHTSLFYMWGICLRSHIIQKSPNSDYPVPLCSHSEKTGWVWWLSAQLEEAICGPGCTRVDTQGVLVVQTDEPVPDSPAPSVSPWAFMCISLAGHCCHSFTRLCSLPSFIPWKGVLMMLWDSKPILNLSVPADASGMARS